MSSGARHTWRAVAATAAACLLVGLVGWAALVGPSAVLTGPGPLISSKTTETLQPTDDPGEIATRDAAQEPERSTLGPVLISALGVAIVAFAACVLAWLGFLLVRRAWEKWLFRRHHDPPPDAEFDQVGPGQPARARLAMAADADEQLRLLLEGQPRNAIVACWHRFEVQAVEAGLARHPWETPSEFALRLLERAEVEPTAISRLLELYREARFSEHDLDEDDRAIAVSALREIQRQVVRL